MAGTAAVTAFAWLVASSSSAWGAAPSQGQGDQSTTTVGTSTEAWYNVTPACGVPGSCVLLTPASADPYPAGTLHIGISQGRESARTYLHLDLSSLPPGTALSGGTLVASIGGSSDGTQSANVASLTACLAPEAVQSSAGGFGPPAVDCSVRSPAAVAGSSSRQLTVDLRPFAAAWDSHPEYGLALLPSADAVAKGSTWHLALEGRGDTEPAAKPITARVSVRAAPANTSQPSSAVGSADGGQIASGATDAQPSPGDGVSTLPGGAPSVAVPGATGAPVSANASAPRGQLGATRRIATKSSFLGADGGNYAAIWLLPLALVLLGTFFAFALIHPVRLDDDA